MKGLKNKYLKSILCIGIGIVILSAAVFANYDNANGYEACKTSLKNMLYLDNVSLDAEFTISMDGQRLLTQKDSMKLAGGQDVFYQVSGSHENLMDNSSSEYRSTSQDKVQIDETLYPDGRKSKMMMPGYRNKNSVAMLSGDDVTAKFVNFAEIAADTMVGDLKNSFVLIGQDDNTRTYTITLSAEQLPDIITSGVSLMIAGVKEGAAGNTNNSEEETRLYNNLLGSNKDPYIKKGTLTVTLNKDDTLSSLHGEVTLHGFDENDTLHSMTVSVGMNAYAYGTTSIERIDTSDAQATPSYKGDIPYTYTEDGEAVYFNN